MTKQDLINFVWGGHALRTDYYGWMKLGYYVPNDLGFSEDEIDRDESNAIWRPKSLQGIENNNGWTKIESEADLPKISGEYWTSVEDDFFLNECIEGEFKWRDEDITHWREVEKPNPPLY